jgi:hypothetical protein
MGFKLEKIVPWGRSYDEYVSMFSLTEADLGLRILGCGDGPAAFNSTLTKRGGNIISVDPIYAFDTEQIRTRISETYETVMTQTRKNKNDFVWESIPSIEQLGSRRMSAMEVFLVDFATGRHEDRYISGKLPSLPFKSGKFDIALSSHFLFLYSAHLSAEFHLEALPGNVTCISRSESVPSDYAWRNSITPSPFCERTLCEKWFWRRD